MTETMKRMHTDKEIQNIAKSDEDIAEAIEQASASLRKPSSIPSGGKYILGANTAGGKITSTQLYKLGGGLTISPNNNTLKLFNCLEYTITAEDEATGEIDLVEKFGLGNLSSVYVNVMRRGNNNSVITDLSVVGGVKIYGSPVATACFSYHLGGSELDSESNFLTIELDGENYSAGTIVVLVAVTAYNEPSPVAEM